MSTPGSITRNGYSFPPGYRTIKFPGLGVTGAYLPWNGALISASPARIRRGAIQSFSVASAPADLSTFVINPPRGPAITFQFVYAGSVQTAGIKIPLVAGGGTAAQANTAIAGVLGLNGGTPLAGSFLSYPWSYSNTGASTFLLQYTVAGPAIAPGGTQATITVSGTVAPIFSLALTVPGRFGKNYCLLHGS